MKAVVQDAYGEPDQVLRVKDVPKPIPRDGEVLVRVRASSVHADVWHVVTGLPYLLRLMGNGLFKPKRLVPGSDLAGEIEAVGTGVTRFHVGDAVYGETVPFAWLNGGAWAEYAAVPEKFLALKPANVTFEQAGSVPSSGFIALSNLAAVNRPGMNVLINGSAGNLGTLAIQIAKARGARVTAVDCAAKLELMRSLGADRVIDYAKESFLHEGVRYDYILDVASNLWFDVAAPALAEGGTYMPIGHADYGRAKGRMGGRIVGSMPSFVGLLLRTMFHPQKRKNMVFLTKPECMNQLTGLLLSGQLTPAIGRTFSLDEAVEALRRLRDGNEVGRIVIQP